MRLTWEAVDSKFGSIFGTLLPGTEARLEPPEGKTFLEGACTCSTRNLPRV